MNSYKYHESTKIRVGEMGGTCSMHDMDEEKFKYERLLWKPERKEQLEGPNIR
jgi:hypothetical protein